MPTLAIRGRLEGPARGRGGRRCPAMRWCAALAALAAGQLSDVLGGITEEIGGIFSPAEPAPADGPPPVTAKKLEELEKSVSPLEGRAREVRRSETWKKLLRSLNGTGSPRK